MPFVRIHLMRGKPAEYRKALGEIVYQAMIDVINVPKDDKFQVISERAPEELNYNRADSRETGHAHRAFRPRSSNLGNTRRHH